MNLKSLLKKIVQKKNLYANSMLTEHLLTNFAFISKKDFLTGKVLESTKKGITDTRYCDNEIIVSLTTYGKRIYEAYYAIESIMQQSAKPNRIILWLENDFKNTTLPVTLQNQVKRGLEIRYCTDIKSYKKLIPALTAFPSAAIITIDDDAIYHFDLIENLINEHIQNRELILCGRLHRIKLLKTNKPAAYTKWIDCYDGFDLSPLNFPTGVGGVLYPPNCFTQEVLNEDVFMGICQYADDIWFKAMALLNNVQSKKIYTHKKNGKDYFSNIQDSRLVHINIGQKMNDIQLKAVFDKYNLYGKLKV